MESGEWRVCRDSKGQSEGKNVIVTTEFARPGLAWLGQTENKMITGGTNI